MTETYSIGLTLALEDGVSAGITVMRRELQALDFATRQTNLTLLRGAAHIAQARGGIAQPERAKPQSHVATAQPGGPEQAARTTRPARPQIAANPAMAPRLTQAIPPMPRAPAALIANGFSPRAIPAVSPGLLANGAASAKTQARAPAIPALRVDVAAIAPSNAATPRAPAIAPLLSRPIIAPPVGVAGQPTRRLAPQGVTVAPTNWRVDPVSARPIARQLAAAPAVSPPLAPTRSAAAPISSAMRDRGGSADAGSAAQAGGDVYLDGTRMGRWISAQLDRAALRPPTGISGVDGRLTPSWPGAAPR